MDGWVVSMNSMIWDSSLRASKSDNYGVEDGQACNTKNLKFDDLFTRCLLVI